MVVNFANLDMKEPPALVLKNACEEVLGFLGFAKNISPDLKYNEVSTIEFEIPEYVDGERVPFFDDVIGMRIVELVGIGQFILVNPSFNGDGIHRVKSCKGYSLEYEFARKKIAIPNGTYQFWKPYSDGNTVLDMIMELMPGWSIGSVSHTLYNKYRTFEVSNENVYNFIKGTVQQTFNCIFDFDTFTRTVNVRDANEQALEKPVVISEDNLATSIEVEEDTESIVTRLDVNGAEGVDIRDVNPCGTNKIINLDYFMTPQNFPQALIEKYYAWKELCESNRQNYYSLSIQYALKVAQRVTELARLTDLKGEMTSLENVQAVTIQGIAQALSTQADLDKANADIAAKQVEIDAKTAEISTLQREQDTIFERLKQIQRKCSFDNYFTASEHLSLDRYIKDDEISDSTFVMSSTTDYKNPSISTKVSGKSISISNAKIEHSTDSAGGNFYSVAGGSLTSQIDGLSSAVISATLEMRSDNSFVFSAYLGCGSINATSFPSACISCTGTASAFVKSDASIRLSITDGFAYFSLDASEYEKRSVAWDLYEYGEEILAKLSQPTYIFSISSANFFSLDEFEMFKNEITLGEKVYVVLSEDHVLRPVFIGVRYNYDEPETMELQFSNSFASGDSSFKLVDLLEQSISLGKDLELSKYIYSSFVDSGASTGLRDFMTSALDVAKNAVLSSTNQAISWDGAGFRLRRWSNDAHTAYDKEQIWMINNSIVMTDDNWATAKMALGKFHDDNFGDCWGIVAPMLVGTLLAGERMLIESAKKDGSTAVFRVDGDGCHLYNSDFILSKTVGNTTSQVILSPDIGLAMGTGPLYTEDQNGRRTLNQENANFWADDQGNLHLKGAVVATSLHIQNQTIKDYVDSESHGVASSIVNEELKNYYTKEECLQEFTITEEKVSSLIKEKYALKTDVANAVSNRPTVIEMQTYVEQTSEHILSTASKDVATQLKNYLKIENFASSIDQHADRIVSTVTSSTTYKNNLNGKANVADLNGLVERVSKAEQKITADAIVSTVTSSETYKNTINGLSTRLSSAEQKITADAIVSTVTSSTTYKNNLNGKANTSDLANYVKATEFSSKISQCSTEILAVVSASGDYYKKQSVVSITSDGITMSGGSIALAASSSFKIASGGSVQITADNTNGSYINFGEAFSASQYGLSAKSGDFKTLKVGGRNVLTEDSLVSGLVSKIVVSPNQPSQKGVIWLQPSSVTSVSYSGDSGPDRSGANCISNTASPSKTLSCLSSDKMPNGTIKYSLTFIVTLVYDSPSSLSDVKLNVTLTKNSDTSLKVSFPQYTLSKITAWQVATVTVETTSSTNLCANTGDITVSISASGVATTHFYLERNEKLVLTASNTNASGTVQACNVYYLP